MIKTIIEILIGIIGTFLFIFIRSKLIKRANKILVDKVPVIGKIEEQFNSSKLKEGMFSLVNKVGWAKTLTQELSFKTILARVGIILVILGVVYGYGIWKGKQGLQPVLNLEGKEEWIRLNSHLLHVKKEGTLEVTELDKKTVLKKITVKDLGNLRESLKPFGFKHDIIGVVGFGIGLTGSRIEVGAGIDYFKFHNWRTDISITNRAFYPLGISYKVTENSAFGISYGYGWKKDTRIFLKYTWEI